MIYENGSIVEEATKKCKELEKELKEANQKIDKIRTINLTATTIAFISHMFGLSIMQPVFLFIAYGLLLTNAITAPSFFKQMSKIEQKEKELEMAKMALEIGYEQEIFPEFNQLQGLVSVEIREVPQKSNNKSNNNTRR